MSTKNKGIKGLEISEKDFPELMTYEDAVSACEKLGEGWRLPTVRELLLMIDAGNDILGEPMNEMYVSSTYSNNGQLWFCIHSKTTNSTNDLATLDSDYNTGHVRAVRTIGKNDQSYIKELANSIKIIIEEQKDNIVKSDSDGIEICNADLSGEYTWFEAIEICKLLGEGWRLPEDADTIESICELVEMYGHYWTAETSAMFGEDQDDKATSADVDGGFAGASLHNKHNTAKLILVRDLS